MAERDCEGCGDLTQIRFLGKIRGKQLCKKCRISIRENHREETRSNIPEEERQKIIELSRKQKADYNKAYNKRQKKNTISIEEPKIKGSNPVKRKQKSNSWLSAEDKRQLLRILMKNGLEFDEAIERLDNVVSEQKRVRKIMRNKNKSEEEINIKQQEMLEELWNS